MAAPPPATGMAGMLMSRLARALVSSVSAKARAIPMYSRNVALTVSSVSTTRPPRTTPTPMATGRLRPARPLGFSESLASSAAVVTLDLEELGFLVLEQLVDLRLVGMGEVVEFALGPVHVVLARVPALDHLVQGVFGVTPDVPDRDAAVLGLVPRGLDVFAAALLGQFRQDDPDDDSVVGGVDAQVAVPDRPLDGTQRVLVERLDDHHPRLRDVERGELVHRGLRPVVVDRDLAEHGRVGATGTDDGELLLGDRDGLVHLLLGFEERVIDHVRLRFLLPVTMELSCPYGPSGSSGSCQALVRLISVPTFSPRMARTTLPSPMRANTTIGSPLSMHRVTAVVSMTFSPRLRYSV